MTNPITIQQRVRHFETDAQNIVFNMWYLGYCDEACADFFQEIGVDYGQLIKSGFDFQLVQADLEWHAPLLARDTVNIAITCDHIGNSSFKLRYALTRSGEPIATIRIVYVGVGVNGGGATPIPELLRARLDVHKTPAPA